MWQCSKACHGKTYGNENIVRKMAEAQTNFIRRHSHLCILFLELGVGENTPAIIKISFLADGGEAQTSDLRLREFWKGNLSLGDCRSIHLHPGEYRKSYRFAAALRSDAVQNYTKAIPAFLKSENLTVR